MEKTRDVSLEFYQVQFEESSQIHISDLSTSPSKKRNIFISKLKTKCIEHKDNVKPLSVDDSSFIEIIEVNEYSIFGIIGKSTEVKEGVLKRIRDNNGKSIPETNFNIQDYKYFLLSIEDFKVVVMQNSNYKAFSNPFRSFLEKFNDSYSTSLKISRIIDMEIEEKLNRMTNIVETDIEFAKNSPYAKQMINLEDSFGFSNDNLLNLKIKLQVKNQQNNNRFLNFVLNKTQMEKYFNSFKIKGIDEDGTNEVVELIKRILTKTVTIKFFEQDLVSSAEANLNEIKKALEKSLR